MDSEQTQTAPRKEIIRCISCHGTMQQGLFRCPHCGQITTGNEKKVSELFLSMQMKARVAERKARMQCRVCGKHMVKGEICPECNTKHRRNMLLFVLIGAIFLAFVLLQLIG